MALSSRILLGLLALAVAVFSVWAIARSCWPVLLRAKPAGRLVALVSRG